MKLIKTLIVGSIISTTLFGVQAFGRGGGGGQGGGGGHAGGGGFASGAVARASFGSAPSGWGSGRVAQGSMAGESGHMHGSIAGRDRFDRFGRGLWGYGGYGWGYTDGFGYDTGEPQPVDDSAEIYERERDRNRQALPTSAFVKSYGWHSTQIARKHEGML